jgi:hypothetical protein
VVRADSSAPSRKNVLESSGSSGESPVALFTPVICRDGEVSVKFRIEPGGASGTAGVVWRYRDPKNYYLLDFNPGRKSISLFKVRDGVRVAIPETRSVAGRDQHDIRPGEWHAAKVIFRGNHIRVFFGNRRLFEAIDSGAASSGRAGVVTSGSTVVAFDDFRIDKKG